MILWLLNIMLILNSLTLCELGLSKTQQRRIEKELKSICMADEFSYKHIASGEFSELFQIFIDSEAAEYLVISSSKGRLERFEYMVVYSKSIEILKIKVINYPSTHGTEITSKRWLKQFVGNSGEKLSYGKDIQAISGATFSASSMTSDIPKISEWVKKVLK